MLLPKRHLIPRVAGLPALALLASLVVAIMLIRPGPQEAAAEPVLLSGVVEISSGGDHVCVRMMDEGVKCWGYNQFGQLGNGDSTGPQLCLYVFGNSVCSTQPVAVVCGPTACTDPDELSGVTSLGTGSDHTCAVMSDEKLKCWGINSDGGLGDDNRPTKSDTPVEVLCGEGPCDDDLLKNVLAVTGGFRHTCALIAPGTVNCWGRNSRGELGDGTTTLRTTPVDVDLEGVVSQVSASPAGQHTCALIEGALIEEGGTVKCWGWNGVGQLGDGQNCGTICTTPVDVCLVYEAQTCNQVLDGVSQISAGGFHTCALMTDDGVKCWGWNEFGELGDDQGCGTSCNTPVDVVCGEGCAFGLLTDVSAVSADAWTTCALIDLEPLEDDDTVCWGLNDTGMLGNGTAGPDKCLTFIPPGTPPNAACSLAPVAVVDLTGETAVSTGGAVTCALLSPEGRVKCWGWNSYGQLGIGLLFGGPEDCDDRSLYVQTCSRKPVDVVTSTDDTDGDGCIDTREKQTGENSETSGGNRDPDNPWDFYDVGLPTDQFIDLANDILGVIVHYAPSGTEPEYDVHFDRGPVPAPPPSPTPPPDPPPDVWDMTAPDGVIDLANDIVGAITQFGHDCR